MDPRAVAEAVAVGGVGREERAVACERRGAVVEANAVDDSGVLRARRAGHRHEEDDEAGSREGREEPTGATAWVALLVMSVREHGPTLGSGPNRSSTGD